MSNPIPDGWNETTVGEISTVKRGASPRPIKDKKWWGGNVGWVRISDVTSSYKYLKKTTQYLSKEGVKKSVQIPKGEVVLSICATIGRPIIVNVDACIHDGFVWFDKLKNSINREYWYYFLASKESFLSEQRQSGTQGNLNTTIVSELICPLPPLPEQKKIATILTSVDNVIEKIQAQIDKLKDLKTGMMQELLTKGIGHTEFKDSPVGRIPVGWEVKTLESLASFVTSGSRGWAKYYSDCGAIFIRIGNLTREHINFRFDDIVYVNPPKTAEGKRTLVQNGDVLISITADLGIIAVVNKTIGEAYVNQHVSLVRLSDINISRWVGHYLAFEDSQKQFTGNNDAGAKAGLNLTSIRKTLLALPSQNEMNKIVRMLDSIDRLIVKKKLKITQVNNIKKSLMQDLLTGKVRVKL